MPGGATVAVGNAIASQGEGDFFNLGKNGTIDFAHHLYRMTGKNSKGGYDRTICVPNTILDINVVWLFRRRPLVPSSELFTGFMYIRSVGAAGG